MVEAGVTLGVVVVGGVDTIVTQMGIGEVRIIQEAYRMHQEGLLQIDCIGQISTFCCEVHIDSSIHVDTVNFLGGFCMVGGQLASE
jgi:hypothetical protein